ncbi:MAG: hypothetical protein B6244_06230 [Candidatus Cloacimonetes bacterium 4572_55]|nr:MAG: hypothetical protein B6244_06230 [Candidatus Cloacimonetes bacterium 4572_55]
MKNYVVIALTASLALSANIDEGFEDVAFPPTDWVSFIGENGEGTSWDWDRSTSYAHSGSACAYIWHENVSTSAQDWLVTPKLKPDAGNNSLSFYMREKYSQEYGTTYTIRVSTDSQTDHDDFTIVRTYSESDITTSFANYTVDLSTYNDSEIYVAFVMEQDMGDCWYLDDVSGIPLWVPAHDYATLSNAHDSGSMPPTPLSL